MEGVHKVEIKSLKRLDLVVKTCTHAAAARKSGRNSLFWDARAKNGRKQNVVTGFALVLVTAYAHVGRV